MGLTWRSFKEPVMYKDLNIAQMSDYQENNNKRVIIEKGTHNQEAILKLKFDYDAKLHKDVKST